MKGQRNQSAIAMYLNNLCSIDIDQAVLEGNYCRCLVLQLPAALVMLLLNQIMVAEMAVSQTTPSAPATNSHSDPAAQLVMRSTLKVGSQGGEVTELQAALQLLGFFTDAVNGVYGQSTAKAVFQFQQVAGLAPDGVVGPATWNRLFPPAPPLTNTPAAIGTAPDGFPIPTTGTPTTTAPTPTATPPTSTQPAPTTNSSDRPASTQAAVKPTPSTLPILRMGMQGSAVTGLQDRLRALGFLKSSADGVFGAETLAAVKAAQQKFSLEADGVVGPATWEALLR